MSTKAKTMKKPTRNPQQTEAEDMLPEYDFRGGVRGKHARALETSPLPESHRAELERRLADLDENPDAGSPWEEAPGGALDGRCVRFPALTRRANSCRPHGLAINVY